MATNVTSFLPRDF